MTHTRYRIPLAAIVVVLLSALAACSSPAPELGDTCESTAQCDPDRALICDNGYCFKVGCASASDCEDGLACIDELCRTPECSADAECGEAAICVSSECIEDGCRSRQGCAAGEVCSDTTNLCRPPPDICGDDGDCSVGESCWPPTGECRTNCSTQDACNAGEYCGSQGQCRPNCTREADCLSDETCTGGRCQGLPDCSDAATCSGPLRYRDPLTCDCVECLEDQQCAVGAGEVCTGANECLFCQLQADDVDCASRGLFERQDCCVECRTDTDCGSDAPFCSNGRCAEVEPQQCVADEECADGAVCDRGSCEPAASFTACERQSDCPDGEACFPDERCHAESDRCGGCEPGTRCVEGSTGSVCAGCTTACSPQSCREGRLCVIPEPADDGICLDEALATQCSG